MRRKFTYALGLVLLVGTVVSSIWVDSDRVYACECDATNSPDERLSEASTVFLGRVTRMHFENWPFDIDSADVPPDEPLTVEFSVHTVWKGKISDRMQLTTARSEGCGYRFNKHVDYLVYADGKQEALEVRPCSATKLASEAQEDLDALGEGYPPEPTEKAVIRPATLGSGCNANAATERGQLVSWPLGSIVAIAWIGIRKRRRSG